MHTNFSSLTLAEIFRDIFVAERSGGLQLTRGTLEKRIYFSRGMILYAESKLEDEDLGKLLVQETKISPGALLEGRRNVTETKDLAQVLVNRGLVGKQALSASVRSIIGRVVGSVFRWDGGSARFHEDWLVPEVFESDILLTFEVILGGIDAMVGFDPIRDAMKGLTNRVRACTPAPVPLDRLALSSAHGYILSRVDDQASVAEIITLLPPGQDELTCKFLYGLVVMGVLEFDPPVGSGPFRVEAILRDHADAAALERAQETMILEAVAAMREQNPHEVLGVTPNPGHDIVERAYEDAKERFSRDRMMPRVQESSRAELSLIESRLLEAYLMMTQARTADLPRSDHSEAGVKGTIDAADLFVRVEMDKTRTQIAAEESVKVAEAYYAKAKKFQREGDFHNAIQYAKLAISYVSEDARFYFILGECQAKNPDARWQRQAEQSFTKACELDTWNADYRVSLGRFYKRRGLKLRARRQFEEALQLVPAHVAALVELESLT